MFEGEQIGMQRLARKAANGAFCRFFQQVRLGAEGGAIFGITDQRIADMGHMHADLVGAAGFQAAFHHRGEAGGVRSFMVTLHHLIMGDRLAGVIRILVFDGAFGAVGTAAECCVDGAAQGARAAPDDGLVGPLQRSGAAVIGKLRGEMPVGIVVLRHDHDA
ncbi:hypothetical protein D3C80_909680 [compost metagenome]